MALIEIKPPLWPITHHTSSHPSYLASPFVAPIPISDPLGHVKGWNLNHGTSGFTPLMFDGSDPGPKWATPTAWRSNSASGDPPPPEAS